MTHKKKKHEKQGTARTINVKLPVMAQECLYKRIQEAERRSMSLEEYEDLIYSKWNEED